MRFALCARFGFEPGRDAAAEAFAYAWEHWDRVSGMENPGGYVYRVGQRTGSKTASRQQALFEPPAAHRDPEIEPGLGPALASLSPRQRTIVVLVHALGMSQAEAAKWLGVSPSTVQKQLERAMPRLRRALGVGDD